jgi:RHS repeat-associated protein
MASAVLVLLASFGIGDIDAAETEKDAFQRPWTPPAPVYSAKDAGRNVVAKVSSEPLLKPASLSSNATAADIRTAGALEASFVEGPKTALSAGQKAALVGLLQDYAASGGAQNWSNIAKLDAFLAANPDYPAKDTLLFEEALMAKRHGHFLKQGELLKKAWDLAKLRDRSDAEERRASEAILAEYLTYLYRLAKKDELHVVLAEIEGLDLGGTADEARWRAKDNLWFLENRAEQNIFCGFTAANDICVPLGKAPIFPDVHDEEEKKIFIRDGLSLHELEAHSHEGGGDLKVVKRTSGSDIPVPSVVHFNFGHYSALTERGEAGVRLKDEHLRFDSWVSEPVLNEQISGYFLVPGNTKLPKEFAEVSEQEAKTLFGRHCVHGRDDEGCGGSTGCGGAGAPMADYEFSLLNPGVLIQDTPISYNSPYGPQTQFRVEYNQRSTSIDDSPTHANFGPRWTYEYLSYIKLNGTGTPNADVSFVDGNGYYYRYTYVTATSTYSSRYGSQPRLEWVPPGIGGPGFVLLFNDGSQMHFMKPNASVNRYYLTKLIDPTGKTTQLAYDSSLRLTTITDALSQVTTLSYTPESGDGVPSDTRKIRKITDPFSREAKFYYDTTGHLKKIVDPVGITSEFQYKQDFVTDLTTPYGTTKFLWGDLPGLNAEPGRYVQATDPLGDTHRAEANDNAGYPAGGHDPNPAPDTNEDINAGVLVNGTMVSFMPKNENLHYRNTYYWDKKMWRMAPGDYSKAIIYNWAAIDGDKITGVLTSTKQPLEGRVWFNYPAQSSEHAPGKIQSPSKIVRAVEGPTGTLTWVMKQADYGGRTSKDTMINPNYPQVGTTGFADNPYGKLLGIMDEEGRTMIYNYAANGIDLLTVQIKDGTNWRTLISYSNYLDHLPQTIVNASGLQTTITYNANRQPTAVTIAKGQSSNSSKFTYDASGYLEKVEKSDPLNWSQFVTVAQYTYDSAKRVRTYTNADGYVRTYDYDNIDRITLITHQSSPNSTTEQFVYDRLDLSAYKDRGGLWSRTKYNAIRKPVMEQDPAGHITQLEWCKCGDIQKIIDPMGRLTEWKRDEQGRVLEKIYADLSKEISTYQLYSGRLATVTPPGGTSQNVTYAYTLSGQLYKEDYAAANTPDVTYTYADPIGRVTQRVDGIGTTSMTYHSWDGSTSGAGKLASVNGPWADDTFYYFYSWRDESQTSWLRDDAFGFLRTETVTFDSLGRLSVFSNDGGTFNRNFNSSNYGNNVDYMTGPSNLRIDYAYYGLAATGGKALKLQSITNKVGSSTISQFSYDYDASGRIVQWDQTQDTAFERNDLKYSRDSQLINQVRKNTGGTVLGEMTWSYDPADNRIVENNGTTAMPFYYNNLNQLTRRGGAGQTLIQGIVNEGSKVEVNSQPAVVMSLPGSSDYSFSRIIDVTAGSNTVNVKATDAANLVKNENWQFNIPAQQELLTYDTNGNMTSGGGRTYTWDSKNRLLSITYGGNTYSFEYDGMDRRVTEKVNGTLTKRWIWDGLDLVEERNASNVLTQNFYKTGLRIGTTTYLYTIDHLGSPREIIDAAAGTVSARYTYDMWGKASTIGTPTVTTPIGFTGHYKHEASGGLIFALYRVYDASLARWISRDPLQIAEIKEGGNLYQYAQSSPVDYLDWLGLDTYTCNRKIGGGPAFPRNFINSLTHTFTFTTNPDGSVNNTYSWGNSANSNGWNKNAPEDQEAAREALDKNYAKKEGDSSLDKHVEDAYNKLNKPENEHPNGGVLGNCKSETLNLLQTARGLQNPDKPTIVDDLYLMGP